MTRTVLAVPRYLTLESFSRAAGLHPEFVLRLVDLGLLEPQRDARGRPLFPPSDLARVARIQRLRAGLTVNYAAVALVMDLLDRIDVLEAALGAQARQGQGGRTDPWTRTG